MFYLRITKPDKIDKLEMSRAWHTYYYQYQKDSGELRFLDHFQINPEIQDSTVLSRIYYRISQDDSRSDEISENEYWDYIRQYTSKPMELEWMPVGNHAGDCVPEYRFEFGEDHE